MFSIISVKFIHYILFFFHIERLPPESLYCVGANCSICDLCFDWYNDDGWKRRDTANCSEAICCFFVPRRNRRHLIYYAVCVDIDNEHTLTICNCPRKSKNRQKICTALKNSGD